MQALAGLAVFLFACGSSSVPALLHVGHSGRWVALVLFLAAAARWAYEEGGRPAVDIAVAGAAVSVVLLTLVSTLWSVDPRLTFERAVTLALLVATALLISQAVAGRRAAAERVLAGLVAGSVLVALAGVVVYAVAPHDAVEISSPELPPRFEGMGQNPNTASLLFSVAMPIAIWMVVNGGSRRSRMVAAAVAALLAGSIVASGSHGALAAAAVGCAAVVALSLGARRATVLVLGAVVAVAGIGAWIETLPKPSHATPRTSASAVALPAAKHGYFDAEINTPLDGELGIPLPGQKNPRALLNSSGRPEAWGGAIRQAEQRPIDGYGFGTEASVFIDRWWTFTGSVPENSYIGIALQLGAVGLVAFGALLVLLVRSGVSELRRVPGGIGVMGIGVLCAALAAAVGQSFIYSVGDVATLTVWVAVFLMASVGFERG